jgi:hypothetical protein
MLVNGRLHLEHPVILQKARQKITLMRSPYCGKISAMTVAKSLFSKTHDQRLRLSLISESIVLDVEHLAARNVESPLPGFLECGDLALAQQGLVYPRWTQLVP